jgi:hypothetical protein
MLRVLLSPVLQKDASLFYTTRRPVFLPPFKKIIGAIGYKKYAFIRPCAVPYMIFRDLDAAYLAKTAFFQLFWKAPNRMKETDFAIP